MDAYGMVIVSLFVGLGVGFFAGLLGIGGGMLLMPIFNLGYGMPSVACSATSLFTIIPTSVSGAITHLRNKSCVPILGVAIGLGGACTSTLGAFLANIVPGWVIMVFAAIVIGYSAFTMLRKALKLPKGHPGDFKRKIDTLLAARHDPEAKLRAAEVKAEGIPPVPHLTKKQLLFGVITGLVTGLVSGFVGVGGAFIMVPMMVQLVKIPMKLTSGTSLIAIAIFSIPGVILQAIFGNVNWLAGIAVAVGSIPGAMIGARVIPWTPERAQRFLFSAFLMISAVMLVIKQMGVFS